MGYSLIEINLILVELSDVELLVDRLITVCS